MPAFRSCPNILLKQQKRLGLSATELVVLLNLTMHWWYEQQMPFPRDGLPLAGKMPSRHAISPAQKCR